MGARPSRFIWALTLGLLALAAVWWWTAGRAIVALNRAALVSAKAVEGRATWAGAETAWLAAGQIAAARPAAHRGLAQVFGHWYRADELAAQAAAQALIAGSSPISELSDALADAGDIFRGRGALATASFFYRGALTRADFSSSARAAEVQRHLALVEQPMRTNLTLSANFDDGLSNWRAWGQPLPTAAGGQAELGCAGCGLAQSLPLLGSGVYEVSFEARAVSAGASVEAVLTLPDDAPWTYSRRWAVSTDWQRLTTFVWERDYGELTWELSLRGTGPAGVRVRAVRVEKVDAPDNRLLNPSFDFYDPEAVDPDFSFSPWTTADFWNGARAQGGWRAAPGADGNTALEIELTSAAGRPERVGVQQPCGSAPAGAAVSLRAELNLPADLTGSAARVHAIFYQSGEAGHYSTLLIEADAKTDGWQRFAASGRAPDLPGTYQCVLTVEIDALQALAGPPAIARFDALAVTVTP